MDHWPLRMVIVVFLLALGAALGQFARPHLEIARAYLNPVCEYATQRLCQINDRECIALVQVVRKAQHVQ